MFDIHVHQCRHTHTNAKGASPYKLHTEDQYLSDAAKYTLLFSIPKRLF